MAGWILIACLKQLFTEFNAIAPSRDHASDGSVGDVAHQAGGTSDHLPDEDFPALRNKDADHTDEVHAIDVDVDLCEPGLTMETVVQFLLGRCRSGTEKRLRYIIFNRRIWEADNGWRERTYTGTADPHTGHAHFSASYDSTLEASTASWHLEDIPVALTAADKTWLVEQIKAAVAANNDPAAAALLATKVTDSRNPTGPKRALVSALVYGDQEAGEALEAAVEDDIKALEAKLDVLKAGQ